MLRSAAAAAVAAAANFGSRRSSGSASQHRLLLQLQLRRRGLVSSATAAANTTTCANHDTEATTRSFHHSSSDPVHPSHFINSTSTTFPTITTTAAAAAAARRYFGSGGTGGGTDHGGDDEDTGTTTTTTKAKKGGSNKKKKKPMQRKTGDDDDDAVVDDKEEILAVTAATATKKDSSTTTDGEEEDDWEGFFGVDYDDGRDRTGPVDQLPPKYVRDAATGRMLGTERIERELSEEERLVLQADPIERDRILLQRIAMDWKRKRNQRQQQPTPSSSPPSSSAVDTTDASDGALVDELGERIRTTNLGFNVLGRSVRAQASRERLDDSEGGTLGITDDGLTLPALTPSEFRAFREYMKRRFHVTNITTDDIPVQEIDQTPVEDHPGLDAGDGDGEDASKKLVDPDGVDIAMRWITTRGQMEMDDLHDDNPYSDLGPSDLSPTRLVNRRRAKPIPRALLHHNNLDLLRRFLTPTGQIQHRIQTRLGARDQRNVARCVKRARALGLVPYAGQFKVERNGWIHAHDIREQRDWEEQLVQRGLTIRRKNKDE